MGWYVVGGRWDGWINDRKASGEQIDANMATTEQAIERHKIPHAIITPDGQWHEHGEMGWWGIMLTENEQWDTDALKLLALYPATKWSLSTLTSNGGHHELLIHYQSILCSATVIGTSING